MARAPDLSSIDAGDEIETITFDFGRSLTAQATILSATVYCTSTKSIDPTPASRLVGSLTIIESPTSGQPAQAVVQLVGNTIANEIYKLACHAVINDGQHLDVWAHLPAVSPN